MFPSTYLKPVPIGGKEADNDQSSIVSHTNHLGLRLHLSTNNKILLNDDADIIAEHFGLFNANDSTKEQERNLILCGHDGFRNFSRTTGSSLINIDNRRLSIAIATTGNKLVKNLKNWMNFSAFDGSHNRFIYMSIPRIVFSRPQHFVFSTNAKRNPSLAHLGVIVHLFGSVRFVFQMSETERIKFCGATFDSMNTDEQSQTQENRSAMYTLWNLAIDLREMIDQNEDEQRQIKDFYEKAGVTLPRLACLIQIYFNAINILKKVRDSILFCEGDNSDLIINDDFVRSVTTLIRKEYYMFDKSYVPAVESESVLLEPMILVEKNAVLAAWKWYEQYLTIASTLFTIDPDFSSTNLKTSPPNPHRKNLKEMIMLFDFNIFPVSSISDKHPITGHTGFLKNRPGLGERALQELLDDNLIKYNNFLIDARGRSVKAYLKLPVPNDCGPVKETFLRKLIKHNINIEDYCSIYEKSCIPPNNKLSLLTKQIFENNASFVNQYSKYRNQLQDIIQKHVDCQNIQETDEGLFTVLNQSAFTSNWNNIINITQESCANKRKTNNLLQKPQPITTVAENASTSTEKESSISELNLQEASVVPKPFHTTTNENLPEVQEKSVVGSISPSEIFDDQSDVEENGKENVENSTSNDVSDKKELAIKKAMTNIMMSKSVIFSKTDLSQICNKSDIRSDALQRLISAKLLRHGNNYWIEPNRVKTSSKKIVNRLLREGWIKLGPQSQLTSLKFEFIQILQKEVGISYDEYLKQFFPSQEKNVFTHNNWLLSDELIQLFQETSFYKEHVRWDVSRFRPNDESRQIEKHGETLTGDVVSSSNNIQVRMVYQSQEHVEPAAEVYDAQGETAHGWSSSTRSKRKTPLHDNNGENQNQKRIQPTRAKKN
ncbi:unnamed protein product [Adineta ricciae]|uniref:Uncharacterized protein n=1 Tax=Adineta ricciae TaxID=249248 RepID=A0A815UK68_ADIRI|nr:unnamed protein product [Adineta ricciae]